MPEQERQAARPAQPLAEQPKAGQPEAGQPEQLTGRDRLVDALRHPRRTQTVVAILLAALGFAAITQLRTNDEDNTYSAYREQDLIDVLNGLAGTTRRAQSEIARLEKAREDLQSTTEQRQAALDQARKQVETLGILAGTVPVTGPGIRIRVVEGDSALGLEPFLDLVQELRSSGAEAIAINGVRLRAQSHFEENGGLHVDGELLESPYVVSAIGDPATLEGAVTFARGPQAQLEDDGAKVSVSQLSTLDIRAVVGPRQGGSPAGDGAQ